MNKNLLKEVIKMFTGVLILSVIAVLVFAILGYFDITVLWGALYGTIICTLNYLFLAFTVGRVVEKDEGQAKGYMGFSYTLRMLFIAAGIIVAIKLPYINYIAAVIPLFFPRIVITALNFKHRKTLKGENEIGRTSDTV